MLHLMPSFCRGAPDFAVCRPHLRLVQGRQQTRLLGCETEPTKFTTGGPICQAAEWQGRDSARHGAVIPRFNHPFDDDARNLLCKALERNVVPVDASALATLGGALNCISLGF